MVPIPVFWFPVCTRSCLEILNDPMNDPQPKSTGLYSSWFLSRQSIPALGKKSSHAPTISDNGPTEYADHSAKVESF